MDFSFVSIKTKLNLTTLAALAGMIFVGISSFYVIQKMEATHHHIESQYKQKEIADRLKGILVFSMYEWNEIFYEKQTDLIPGLLPRSETIMLEYETFKSNADKYSIHSDYYFTSENKHLFFSIQNNFLKAAGLFLDRDFEKAQVLVEEHLEKTIKKLFSFFEYSKELRKGSIREIKRQEEIQQYRLFLIWLIFFAALLAIHLFIGININRSIINPVLNLTSVVKSITNHQGWWHESLHLEGAMLLIYPNNFP